MALPLALYLLVAVALLAVLALERRLLELRISRGELAAARAAAAEATVLADLLRNPADPTLLAAPRGAATTLPVAAGLESTSVTAQPLGGGVLRVVTIARARSGGVRAEFAAVALLRAAGDSSTLPPVVRLRPLPGSWWTPIR